MHVCVLCTCLVAIGVREDIIVPGSGDTDGCNLPWGCPELNLDPLQKQLSLLTAELSLQTYLLFFKYSVCLFRGTHVSRGQKKKLVEVCFFLLLYTSWGWNSICQAWWQVLLTAEPFHY